MKKLSPLQLGLLKKGIIDLHGDVNGKMLHYVRECMMRLALKDNPPISIKITSSGGDVWFGLLIYDLFRSYPGKKTGTVIVFARSMAAIILQACDKREATQNSCILVHNIHVSKGEISLDEFDSVKQMKKIKDEIRKDQEKVHLILEKRTNKSRKTIMALCKKAYDLSAQEALDVGLIDKII